MSDEHTLSAFSQDGRRCNLYDPTQVPKADAFLWNNKMLCHVTAHGFAQSQFMQPEPSFYSHAPLKAAKAAMAPEPQYFDHHPGRFVYIRDDETGAFFSAPYRPTNISLDRFEFSPGLSDIKWLAEKLELQAQLRFAVPPGDDIVELWHMSFTNLSKRERKLSVFVYFPVGFPSWMNTEGRFDDEIGGMLAYTLTPYRKLEDYPVIKQMKDFTYLLSDVEPTSWEASLASFEGLGGLRHPAALSQPTLSNTEAAYETAACIMQYQITLSPSESFSINLLFGPANNREEILRMKDKYLQPEAIDHAVDAFDQFYRDNLGCITIETPDKDLDHFINHWLPRQILYHAHTLRMVTDPQTRNHIQDAMGMIYIEPSMAKTLYLIALAQQETTGEMPDGILLMEGAELKYVNQVPHRDHCVWAAYAITAYLDETGDYDFLDEVVGFANVDETATVYEHVCRGIEWLIQDRSERGFSYIGQGDWNDPMNMAGHKGKGESIWLTQAMLYAIRVWLPICERQGDSQRISTFTEVTQKVNATLNRDAWTGDWYARGITDDGILFGVPTDEEGQIFLNTQSFGILCNAADDEKLDQIITAVDERLMTPYGLVLLAPSYTHMREDVGRVTQKHPSTAENGSVYCHANAFYTQALYERGRGNVAYPILRALLPGPAAEDLIQREHLPIYIPNYYRGAHNPRMHGKASHLMNTGSLVWIYRCFIEGMIGLKGEADGLCVQPQLPAHFEEMQVQRRFRGKRIQLTLRQVVGLDQIEMNLNGKPIDGPLIPTRLLQDDNELLVQVPAAGV